MSHKANKHCPKRPKSKSHSTGGCSFSGAPDKNRRCPAPIVSCCNHHSIGTARPCCGPVCPINKNARPPCAKNNSNNINNNNIFPSESSKNAVEFSVEAEVDRLVAAAKQYSENEKIKLKQFYEEEIQRKKDAVIKEFKCAMETDVIAPLKAKLCACEKELELASKQECRVTGDLENANATLKSLQEDNGRLQNKISELQGIINAANEKENQLIRALKEKEDELKRLGEKYNALNDENERLRRELEDARNRIAQLEKEIEDANERSKKDKDECSELSARAQCIMDHEKRTLDVTNQLVDDNQAMQERIKQLEEQLDQMRTVENSTGGMFKEIGELQERAQARVRELEELLKMPETCKLNTTTPSNISPEESLPNLPMPDEDDFDVDADGQKSRKSSRKSGVVSDKAESRKDSVKSAEPEEEMERARKSSYKSAVVRRSTVSHDKSETRAQLFEKMEQLEQEFNQVASDLENANQRIEETEAALTNLQEDNDNLRSRVNSMQGVIAMAYEKEKKLNGELKDKENELSKLAEKYDASAEENERMKKELAQLKDRYEDAVKQREQLEKEVKDANELMDKNKKDFENKLQEKSQEDEKELKKMTDKYDAAQEENERMKKELAELREKDKNAKIKRDQLEHEIKEANDKLEKNKKELQQKIQEQEKDRKEFQQKIQEHEKDKKEIQQKLQEQEKKAKKAEEQCSILSAKGQCILEHERKTLAVTNQLAQDNNAMQERIRQLEDQLEQLMNMENKTRSMFKEIGDLQKRAQARTKELEELKKLPETCKLMKPTSLNASPVDSLPNLPVPSDDRFLPMNDIDTTGAGTRKESDGGSAKSGIKKGTEEVAAATTGSEKGSVRDESDKGSGKLSLEFVEIPDTGGKKSLGQSERRSIEIEGENAAAPAETEVEKKRSVTFVEGFEKGHTGSDDGGSVKAGSETGSEKRPSQDEGGGNGGKDSSRNSEPKVKCSLLTKKMEQLEKDRKALNEEMQAKIRALEEVQKQLEDVDTEGEKLKTEIDSACNED